MGGDGQALVLGATAGAFGTRFGQQLTAARQHVERGKVVARALGATNEICRAIGAQQDLGGAQPSVVVVAHGVAMRAGVVDYKQVAHVDLRQLAVDGKLVVVLAQVTRDVVGVRNGRCDLVGATRLAHHRNVVVGTIHSGTNEVDGACVHADIVLVNLLLVDGLGDQASVGTHHKATHLGADCHIAHAGGDQNLVVGCVYALADGVDVVSLLLGQVGDTHTAGQIDKGDMCAGLALQAHGKFKEDTCELGVVVVGDGVTGKEGMDAKILGAFGLEHTEGLKELLGGHAVLGVAGVIHDAVRELEQAARIKAAADRLGDGARDALKELDVADVVKVDDGTQFVGELKVRRRRVVGREHDVVAGDTQRAGNHELGIARAIAAAAVFVENGDERRVGIGLDGKVFLKARVPRKGVAHLLHVAADACLVV